LEIKQLKQEKTLNLNGYRKNNKLTSLPKEIGDLKQLKKLSLIGNQLTSLPKEIGDLGENGVQIEGLFDSSNNGGFGDGGSGFERN
jgi:Leucine-rich repeat (LRR) protein